MLWRKIDFLCLTHKRERKEAKNDTSYAHQPATTTSTTVVLRRVTSAENEVISPPYHTLFFFCQMWLLLNSVDNVMPLTENCLCLFPSFSCLKVLLLQRTRSSCFLIVYTTLWTSFEKLKRAIYKTLFNSNPYLSSSPPSFKSQKTQIRKGELRRMTFRAQNELQFWQPRVDMQFQSISPLLC